MPSRISGILVAVALMSLGAHGGAPLRALTFEDRVRLQKVIERVYYSHQIGATTPFDEAVPQEVLERKVRAYLQTPVTEDALRREVERIAASTRMPDRLLELYHALEDDPILFMETVGRATLVERLRMSPSPGGAESNEPVIACVPNDAWDNGTSNGWRPSKRRDVPSVWTGTYFIVWGGWDGVNNLDTGGRYDPILDAWSRTSMVGAPSGRSGHALVWTGQEVFVWGGVSDGFQLPITGGRYDPVADTWIPTSIIGTPAPRYVFTSVWTGSQVIVWGGANGVTFLKTGGRYDPATNTWTAMSAAGPSERAGAVGVWTGARMVVWGGTDDRTGGRYDPVANTWMPTSLVGAPSPRLEHHVVWTGGRMIVWGGYYADVLDTGALYDPVGDAWTETTTVGAPEGRSSAAAVWTGQEMIVWGGVNNYDPLSSGGRYNPSTNSWAATSLQAAPSPRFEFAAAWADQEMIVWGGLLNTSGNLVLADDGGRYTLDQSADADLDGFTVCSGDCDDGDPGVWGTPAEALDLRLDHDPQTASTSLSWTSPSHLGGVAVTYDVIASTLPDNFMVVAICVDSDATATSTTDRSDPTPGSALFFLVRAENRCPGTGEGPLGSASDSTPISGRHCP